MISYRDVSTIVSSFIYIKTTDSPSINEIECIHTRDQISSDILDCLQVYIAIDKDEKDDERLCQCQMSTTMVISYHMFSQPSMVMCQLFLGLSINSPCRLGTIGHTFEQIGGEICTMCRYTLFKQRHDIEIIYYWINQVRQTNTQIYEPMNIFAIDSCIQSGSSIMFNWSNDIFCVNRCQMFLCSSIMFNWSNDIFCVNRCQMFLSQCS